MPSATVVSLPVNPSKRASLLSAGLSCTHDLRGLSADGLAQAAGLTQAQAASVLELSLGMTRPGWRLSGAMSAAELLSNAHGLASHSSGTAALGDRQRRISTGCRRLDELLGGGGLACGTVTEFFGVPGVGKTQVGMQLAVNAQLPQHLGGLGGKVLYIDTEGSFMTDRLIDMAAAAVQRVQQRGAAAAATIHQQGQQQHQQQHQQQQQSDQQQAAGAASVSVESILANILHFRVQNHAEQLALTRVLGTLLTSQPEVVLVVIDSVTFHFRQDFRDAAQRARLMAGMAGQLAAAAEQHNVAVVMMNQVVTRIAEQPGRGGAQAAGSSSAASSSSSTSNAVAWLAPALGEGWGQAAACRVALFWEGSQRLALLVKAKEVPQQQRQQQQAQPQVLCAAYQVGPSGVTD